MDNIDNNAEKAQNKKSKILDSNANFLYTLTSNRLQSQLQQIDSLDSKIINLLGFSCTLAAILAAAIAIIKITSSEIAASYVSLGFSVSAFIFIVTVTLKSYSIKPWHVGPDLKEAWQFSHRHSPNAMLRWSARSFTRAYYHNRKGKLIKNKISTIKQVSISLIIQIVSLIATVILVYIY